MAAVVEGVTRLNDYVDGVLKGKIKAPRTIKLACERHKRDLKKKTIYFDERAANAAIRAIECFKHAKNQWQGSKVVLEPWQCFWVGSLFGWKWSDNDMRRFRTAYVKIPRKNGKSFIAICIALLMLAVDREPGAEVYLGATNKEDAHKLLFEPAKFIVQLCPSFKKRFGIRPSASALTIDKNLSSLKPVIRKPSDGSSPHCAVVDEYHLHETSDQFEVFDTGMAARRQPLLLVTTTAGNDMSRPCYDFEIEVGKLLEGQYEDDTIFGLVFTMDEDDDWRDFENWEKVNPNLGITVDRKYLKSQHDKAKRDNSQQNKLRTKHGNEWVGSLKSWMNVLHWQRQSKPDLLEERFKHCSAHGHVDLASHKDAACINLTFKDGDEYFCKQWYFVPHEAVYGDEANPKYQQYVNSGDIIVTPGEKTDQGFIEEKIKELHKEYHVLCWSFDDYQGDYIMTRLDNEGFPIVNYGATVKNFSNPMKLVDAMTTARTLYNDGNLCTIWMMGNVVAREDEKSNIFPRKSNKNNPQCKIDGPVSIIATHGTWLQNDGEGSLSDFLDNPVGAK